MGPLCRACWQAPEPGQPPGGSGTLIPLPAPGGPADCVGAAKRGVSPGLPAMQSLERTRVAPELLCVLQKLSN